MKLFIKAGFIFTLLALPYSYLYAQSYPNFDIIKLEKPADFRSAEPFAMITANLLLSRPVEKGNADRLKGLEFIIKWMKGTSDHSFIIDDRVSKITNDNDDLAGLYMAAMTKYTLENKAASKDAKLVRLNTMILLLQYCENKENNIKMSKQLKKLSEAKAKGELENKW